MGHALIFDCDGVLADTERDGHLVAFNRLFDELDLGVRWTAERYAVLLGIGGGKERMRTLFDDPGFVTSNDIPEEESKRTKILTGWHQRKTEIYLEIVRSGGLRPRPGVDRLAGEATSEGWRIAVASTSAVRSVQAIVDHVFPATIAATIAVFAGDMVAARKPAPDIYLLALHQLDLDPSDVCVVEDSSVGQSAAIAADCPTIVTVSDFTAGETFRDAALVVSSLGDENAPAITLASQLAIPIGHLVTIETVRRVMALDAEHRETIS